MADQTERLLLQVDAATELLRQHLGQAEQPLDRFERRATKMVENVDRSIGQMGKQFPAFAKLAESAAEQAERSFEASFSQIERIAAKAIKGPTIDGRVDLGTDDLRAAAALQQQQARAYALIGEAAERAALGVGDTTQATRLFIQASDAARIEAERNAAALLAEAGALERVEIELRQSAAATDLFVTSHQRIDAATQSERQLAAASRDAAAAQAALAAQATILRGEIDPMYVAQQRFNAELDRADNLLAAGTISQREYGMATQVARDRLYAHAQAVTSGVKPTTELTRGQGALRSAMQGLSFQAQDTFTQLSMGANAFQVIAIQGGQAAGQFANVEGKAGSFARFMIGPYGLAITAALLVLGPLVEKTIEYATSSERSAAAVELHRRAMALLDEAVNRLNQSQAKLNHTTRQGIQDDLDAAEAKRQHIVRTRQLIDAQLGEAKGKLTAAQITQSLPGGSVPGSMFSAGGAQAEKARQSIAAIEGAQKINDRKLADTNTALAAGRAQLVMRGVAARTDAATAATQRYEDAVDRLQRKFEKGGFGDPNSDRAQKAFGAAAEREKRKEQAALEALKPDKKGPSAETLARRAEAARVKELTEENAFTEAERVARRKLLEATRKTASSEAERDALLREDINAEATANAKKIANNKSAKKLDDAEAARLLELNEATRKQRLENVDIDRRSANIAEAVATSRVTLQGELAAEQLRASMATTVSARRDAELRILDLTETLEKQAQQAIIDDPKSTEGDRDRARLAIAAINAQRAGRVGQIDQQNRGPMASYKAQLEAEVGDLNSALEGVEARGFQSLEDGLQGVLSGTKSVGEAFSEMANSIIADLARVAAQKIILSLIGGATGIPFLRDGGSIADAPGFADGGSPGGLLRGPGTSRSDSILALLNGPNGRPIRLSTKEFIMNAAAVEHYGTDVMSALNSRQLPRFASGGALSTPRLPSASNLRYPRLPEYRGRSRDRMEVDVRAKVEASPLLIAQVEQTSVRTVTAAAEPIMAGAQSRTVRALNRPQMPGGTGW